MEERRMNKVVIEIGKITDPTGKVIFDGMTVNTELTDAAYAANLTSQLEGMAMLLPFLKELANKGIDTAVAVKTDEANRRVAARANIPPEALVAYNNKKAEFELRLQDHAVELEKYNALQDNERMEAHRPKFYSSAPTYPGY